MADAMSTLRRFLYTFTTLACLWLPASTSWGQTGGVIEGRVRDAETGEALAAVNVVLEGATRGTATLDDGSFVLQPLTPETHTLVFSRVGYASVHRDVAVSIGDTTRILVGLIAQPVRLDRILVETDPALSTASSRTVREFDLRIRPKRSSQQLLQVVPGLVVAQHAGGGKAEQIFLRGFDNDHGTDVAVSVDGMPVNMVSHGHGQGYADLHFLIPDVVERVDVYKGPYFAEFGNLANAGHVAFRTRERLPANSVRMEGGQLGTAHYTLLYQLPVAEETAHSAYFAGDYYHTDGPFDHPQGLQRLTLFAKGRRILAPGTVLTLDVGGFSSSWDASGQIPERAVERGLITRWGAIDPLEGGNTSRHNINLTFRSQRGDAGDFTAQAYWSDYDYRLYSNFTFFRWDVEYGNMIEQSDKRRVVGLNSTYSDERLVGAFALSPTLGGGFRSDDIDTGMWQAIARRRYWPLSDVGIRERNYFLWGRQDVAAGGWRLSLGLRADYFTFDVEDALEITGDSITPLIDIVEQLRRIPLQRRGPAKPLHMPLEQPHASGIADDIVFSPKANLSFAPTADLDLFLNYGQGFHSNDARAIVTGLVVEEQKRALEAWGANPGEIRMAFRQISFDPDQAGITSLPRTQGAELGLRTRLSRRLNLGAALWWIDVDEELVYAADVGWPQQQGRTRRTGIDLEARARLRSWLWADADLNLARGRLRDPEEVEQDAIPLAPTVTSTAGLTLRRSGGYEGSLRLRHIGDRPAAPDRSLTAMGYTVFELTASRRWNRIRVEVTAENVLDTEWNEAQFATESLLADEVDAAMRGDIPPAEIHFTPGNPFNVRAGISILY